MSTFKNISHLFTLQPLHAHGLKNAQSIEDCGYIPNATVCVDDKTCTVSYVGPSSSAPKDVGVEHNCAGETWLPGLIDAHTHLVFGGQRAVEMMKKRAGTSYLQIAKEGGGIQSTVRMTRACSEKRLIELATERVFTSMQLGVRHIEIKSGYGLDVEQEMKLLRVIESLKNRFAHQIGVTSTFLGAHAIPADKKAQDYMTEVCEQMLPQVVEKKLAEFCDVFIEEGFFTLKQGEQILKKAQALGLKLKAHVDECTAMGGLELACEMGAVSVEHGIKITDAGIKALSDSTTTLVLLPLTSLVLQEGYAPGRKLIDNDVRVAIATDFNPGTSPSQNLVLAALIGMIHYGLSPFETLSAITYNAACACDKQSTLGHISVGNPAWFTRFAYEEWQELFYWVGQPLPIVHQEGR